MNQPLMWGGLIYEEIPGYPGAHGSTLTEAPNGDIVAAWYAGAYEKAKDVAIFISRLPKGEKEWTKPEILNDAEGLSEGNPVLFTGPDGTMWFFYVVMYGDTWNDCKVHYRTSADGGKTWGGEETLIKKKGWMTRNHPLVLENGTFLLPIYNEMLYTPGFLLTRDDWKNTKRTGTSLRAPGGLIQPTVVQLSDGSLLTYFRSAEQSDKKNIWMSTSQDGGLNWTDPARTSLPNPDAAVDLVKLQNGHLVLIYNHSSVSRLPLSAALSTDEGKTWSVRRDLEDEGGSYSYPSVIQASDGTIHVTYTYRRLSIKHVAFSEEWIKQKQ
ncbi:MAG: sialidase family protein [bacterium]